MHQDKHGMDWSGVNKRGLFRALGMAAGGAMVFNFIILFSWNHVRPEMFNLPWMRFSEALGATGLLFSAGFLLSSGRAHVRDHRYRAASERESPSSGGNTGNPG